MNPDIVIQVPASTSNLGPGFDTLGIALNLYNRIQILPRKTKTIRIISAIAEEARPGAEKLLREAAQIFFRKTGVRSIGFDVALSGLVPIARGLGSSVTVRLGVIAGLNQFYGTELSGPDLLNLVSRLEHHPDNAAPAIFGGFTVAGQTAAGYVCHRFPVSSHLKFVALIPHFEVSTESARKLVPSQFSKTDTVHNLNRAALITAAFARKDYPALRGLLDDRVHQPYRQKLIPDLFRVIRAAEKAGAIGGWLSGSGSTIICIALENADGIGKAMQRILPESDLRILRADNYGYRVVRGH